MLNKAWRTNLAKLRDVYLQGLRSRHVYNKCFFGTVGKVSNVPK